MRVLLGLFLTLTLNLPQIGGRKLQNDPCPAGYFYNGACRPCPGGTYYPHAGYQDACIPCPLGTYTSGCYPASKCSDCDPGSAAYWVNNGDLLLDGAGHACEGYYDPSSTRSADCGSGGFDNIEQCSCFLYWGGLDEDGSKALISVLSIFFGALMVYILNEISLPPAAMLTSTVQIVAVKLCVGAFCFFSFLRDLSHLSYISGVPIWTNNQNHETTADEDRPVGYDVMSILLWLLLFAPMPFFVMHLVNNDCFPAWYFGAPPAWAWYEDVSSLWKLSASALMCTPWALLNSPWLFPVFSIGYFLYLSKLLSFKVCWVKWSRVYAGEKSTPAADAEGDKGDIEHEDVMVIDRRQLNMRCLSEIWIILPTLAMQILNNGVIDAQQPLQDFAIAVSIIVLLLNIVRYYYFKCTSKEPFLSAPLDPFIFSQETPPAPREDGGSSAEKEAAIQSYHDLLAEVGELENDIKELEQKFKTE